MLFLHGIDLAASSYEMKPLFERYARERSVYALDLPGFGFSERSEQLYTPAVYRDAINQFVALELRGEPVDAVALSLSCEFLALAARQRPELFRTLTLISPTGISTVAPRPRSDRWLRLLLDPRWSRIIYDTLTSRYGLSHFLQKRQRRQVDRRTLHYAYVSSHQPMAQVAPFHYVAGKLCTPEIISVYRSLTQPVLAIYGAGRDVSFDMMDNLRSLPNWQVVEYRQSGEYVHLDEPDNVIAQMGHFLRTQTTA
jgi:pimeloyl-ACP methyl ester carboxylesterase